MDHDGDGKGSISCWLGGLRDGDQAAAGPLWDRYAARLIRLAASARRRHALAGPGAAEADSEDAALSAFDSFCAGAARGRFPDLADRNDLWRLLAVITARKVRAQARRVGSAKRGGDRPVATAGEGGEFALDRCAGREPDPGLAAEVAEAFGNLLERLDDDGLRRVALDRLDGYTNDEIAARLGCARRTVARRLDLIRRIWSDAATRFETRELS